MPVFDLTEDVLRRGVALLGAGAVGQALAARLAARGYPVQAVVSRRPEAAATLAARVGAPLATTSLEDLPPDVRLVLCAVPDDALPGVAEALARLDRPWADHVVAHTSGALGADVLAALARQGAATLAFHPLQTFPPGEDGAARFDGIYIGLQGSERGVALGRRLAGGLGAHPFVVPAGGQARYHLAASMASNFLVTLQALAGEVLATLGLDAEAAADLLRPLVDGTWQGLARHTPEAALTGPVVRGDHATVTRHLDALREELPHLLPVYVALAVETVRLAVRSGRLEQDAAQRLLDRLVDAVEPPPPPSFLRKV